MATSRAHYQATAEPCVDCTTDECDAGHTHYHVDITNEMLLEAADVHDQRGYVDDVDERPDDRSELDSKLGILAEVVAKTWLDSQGVPVEYSPTLESDLVLGGLAGIDVKMRDRRQTHGRDLLVRQRDGVELSSQGYLQVIFADEMTTAVITGWAHLDQVREADWFSKARTWPTRIVDHDDLRPVGDLVDFFS